MYFHQKGKDLGKGEKIIFLFPRFYILSFRQNYNPLTDEHWSVITWYTSILYHLPPPSEKTESSISKKLLELLSNCGTNSCPIS